MKKILNKLGITRLIRIYLFKFVGTNIFSSQLAKFLIDEFDGYWGHWVERDKGNLGFGYVHFGLIASQKPKRILCIGSQRGFVPVICALACKHNKKGHVDFVDAGFDLDHPKAWSGDGFWTKNDPKKHFGKVVSDKWITTYVMTTKDFAKKYKREYDYIYIDGDHSYKGVKTDYQTFWPRLTKGGYMSFHDALAKGSFKKTYHFGVNKLWEEISKKTNSIYFSHLPGLGILQK